MEPEGYSTPHEFGALVESAAGLNGVFATVCLATASIAIPIGLLLWAADASTADLQNCVDHTLHMSPLLPCGLLMAFSRRLLLKTGPGRLERVLAAARIGAGGFLLSLASGAVFFGALIALDHLQPLGTGPRLEPAEHFLPAMWWLVPTLWGLWSNGKLWLVARNLLVDARGRAHTQLPADPLALGPAGTTARTDY